MWVMHFEEEGGKESGVEVVEDISQLRRRLSTTRPTFSSKTIYPFL